MSTLRFDEVTVRYGTRRTGFTAVDHVTLDVPTGKVLGLVGESGSGKSTLARSAVGLVETRDGSVTVNGTDVRNLSRRNRPIQMVFQDPYASLDPRMKVGASIAEAMPRALRRERATRLHEVARLLELAHLDPETADLLPGELSGGQRQRVAIARALAGRPEVVIADEITSALDVSVQGTILNLVRDLQRDLNLTLLFISHNLAVIQYVSDYIAVMYLGHIVEHGPAADVLANPVHPYTRDLLAAAPSARPSSEHLACRTMASTDDAPKEATASPAATSGPETDIEPADPHAPPSGCRYHPRCPVGPNADTQRQACVTDDPTADQEDRLHRAACHYAAPSTPEEGSPA